MKYIIVANFVAFLLFANFSCRSLKGFKKEKPSKKNSQDSEEGAVIVPSKRRTSSAKPKFDREQYIDSLSDSLKVWNKAKSTEPNYKYSVSNSQKNSMDVYQTTIFVTENIVVKRTWEKHLKYVGWGQTLESWVEESEDVGKHTGEYIADAVNLDDLYKKCNDEILSLEDNVNYKITIDLDDKGFLRRCVISSSSSFSNSVLFKIKLSELSFDHE